MHHGSICKLKKLTDKKQAIMLREFSDNKAVREIIGKLHTLKETNIIVERDLTHGREYST